MATRNAQALATLGEWMGRIEASKNAVAKGQATRRMSKRTLELVKEGFDKEQSPTGKKWKAHRPGYAANNGPGAPGPGILSRTGKLKSSISARVRSSGAFEVSSPLNYAAFHQEGRRGPWEIRAKNAAALVFEWFGQMHAREKVTHPGYPARPFLPDAAKLPARYIREYTKIAQDVVFRHLIGRRRK